MIQAIRRTIVIGGVTGLLILTAAIGIVATDPRATARAADCKDSGTISVFPAWYKGLCNDKGDGIVSPKDIQKKLPNDTSGIATFITKIATNLVELLLYVVGYVSLIFIIWGGFKYMISGDNASGTSSAKKTILNAVIGLILSIMAIAIVNLITGAIA
jgi:hypothetical protein